MRADTYQTLLIASGAVVAALVGVFFYREVFPEYRIYQDTYIELEEFRSTYTHQPPPVFNVGIKQIVIEREDRGPPIIDRCTSCHVALQIPHFSPTKIARDINGNILRDAEGKPILEPNNDYVWGKLEQKIAELRDEKVNEQLEKEGKTSEVNRRLTQAEKYESLKTAHVGEHVYDMKKALIMHPLIGKETRPFEYHPVEEYGCTSCHNGNGRAITTDKAHGPVFDEQYEIEYRGFIPQFTEPDPDNDPKFAHMFNAKPGHHLLFQTTPLFIGPLIQSRCIQCHQTSQTQLESASMSASEIAEKQQKQFELVRQSFEQDKQTLLSLLELRKQIMQEGVAKTLEHLKEQQNLPNLSGEELERFASHEKYINTIIEGLPKDEEQAKTKVLHALNQELISLVGSLEFVDSLQEVYNQEGEKGVDSLLKEHQDVGTGILFVKMSTLQFNQELIRHMQDTQQSFQTAVQDQQVISNLKTDIDDLTRNYKRGEQLYLSQACYACHRIAGLARGGVGPDLTRIGDHYPWYIKESMVWPQADLVNSTMPNIRLDHEELEDLMTFLLAQKGGSRAISESSYRAAVQSWEAGRKLPWERPIPPAQIFDLRDSMTVFATEGCASCHRLLGFESNVGFKVEKDKHTFEELYEQKQWFKRLFPEVIRISQYDEEIPGSLIVSQIDKHADEIDERIVSDVRQNSILEEIDHKYPEAIEALYSNFRYASRSKDHYYRTLAEQETDPEKRSKIVAEHADWKDRVHRVLMTYIQTYGLGRIIGPHLNWSGIFRTDEWLMEHFRNPTAHVPRSIMPAMPFDDTKFYALTYMLDQLAIHNRDANQAVWRQEGFSPQEAYETHCMQCHGISLAGNGAISEWIYPIPKSLRDPIFMRNLTKERAIYSITHGVKGTPMPPWGEVATDKPQDIAQLVKDQPVLTKAQIQHIVDWLFASLPGGEVIKEREDVPKWEYTPQDVLEELNKEGGKLQSLPPSQIEELPEEKVLPERELPQENVPPPKEESVTSFFPTGEGYYAAIRPEVYPLPKASPQEKQLQNEVEEVFDVITNAPDSPDPLSYYIKKEYYTPYNLQMGQKFFLLNCAVCHGNEGDGSGSRARAMQEAKPRMLTNLDWIRSRDDLRLLRSIKFGVPGTSMTPWGDLTSSLQRLQLVMFIRTLTREQDRRDELASVLYQTFETAQLLIDRARVEVTEKLAEYQKQEQELRQQLVELERQVTEGREEAQQVVEVYQQSLQVAQEIKRLQERDQLLVELKKQLQHERELYSNLGIGLITKDIKDQLLETYFNLIQLNQNRYHLKDHQLTIQVDPHFQEKIRKLQNELIKAIDQELAEQKRRKIIVEGKIQSAQTREELTMIDAEILSYSKLKTKLLTDIEEALRSFEKQQEIVIGIRPMGVRPASLQVGYGGQACKSAS